MGVISSALFSPNPDVDHTLDATTTRQQPIDFSTNSAFAHEAERLFSFNKDLYTFPDFPLTQQRMIAHDGL